jgi:hypothetical protein
MDLYAKSKDDDAFDKAAGLTQIVMEEGEDDPKVMNDSEFDQTKFEAMDVTKSPSNAMDGNIKSMLHA